MNDCIKYTGHVHTIQTIYRVETQCCSVEIFREEKCLEFVLKNKRVVLVECLMCCESNGMATTMCEVVCMVDLLLSTSFGGGESVIGFVFIRLQCQPLVEVMLYRINYSAGQLEFGDE